jgi:predicted phage terminase large subunit-like protein
MLLTTNGQMIVLSTPRGKNGKYYGYYKDEAWKKYEVKVSNNPRMQTPDKAEFLLSELRQKGTRMYGQEYECEFLGNLDGSIFKRGWMKVVDSAYPSSCPRVRFWDIAATAKDIRKGNDPDWLVGVLMAYNETTNRVCIEDVCRIQGTPEEGERLQYDTAMSDGSNVKIRDEEQPGAAGKVLTYNYARTIFRGYDYVSRSPSGDKTLRASPFAAACERGDVDMLSGAWNNEYLDELCAFPLGRHDDQVDASSGAYTELTQNKASLNVWFI